MSIKTGVCIIDSPESPECSLPYSLAADFLATTFMKEVEFFNLYPSLQYIKHHLLYLAVPTALDLES
eukprot:10810972-Ditylum_brightwellii.AAC.1